jgi:sec-independent protein translocase protein TatA
MGRIGVTELLLILGIALLLFGPSKLAEMGKGLGEGLKNFKKGLAGDDAKPSPAPAPPLPPNGQAADPNAPGTGGDGNTPPAA